MYIEWIRDSYLITISLQLPGNNDFEWRVSEERRRKRKREEEHEQSYLPVGISAIFKSNFNETSTILEIN